MDRLPPTDMDAEIALLGCALDTHFRGEPFDLDRLRCVVSADMFSLPDHGRVYQAMLDAADASEPATDPRVLQRRLNGQGSAAEWQELLASLAEQPGSPAGLDYYADRIVETWQRREIIRQCEAASDEAFSHSPDVNAAGIAAELKDRLRFIGASSSHGRILTRRYSDISDETTGWIWQDRFPAGMLSLLAGLGEQGKSMVALDMAARVSTGRAWPDEPNKPQPAGDVVIASLEDDPNKTIGPRLTEAGADRSRVIELGGVGVSADVERQLDLERDMRLLEATLDETPGVRLVVLDPLSGFLGREIDSWKDDQVRRVLGPLTKLAHKTGAAFVGIAHLNKNAATSVPAMRVLGTVGFTNAARAVWFSVPDENDDCRKLLLRAKCNLAPPKSGLAYRIVNNPATSHAHLEWEIEPVDETLIDAMQPNRATMPVDIAMRWLNEWLAYGPRHADESAAEAERQGITKRTLARARVKLGVVSNRAQRTWFLPHGVKQKNGIKGNEGA